MNRTNLLAAITAGTVTETAIDEKVRHILTTAGSFGWLDLMQLDSTISLDDATNNAVALDSAARESVVLLKNDGARLPLAKSKLKSVLVVGPDACCCYSKIVNLAARPL